MLLKRNLGWVSIKIWNSNPICVVYEIRAFLKSPWGVYARKKLKGPPPLKKKEQYSTNNFRILPKWQEPWPWSQDASESSTGVRCMVHTFKPSAQEAEADRYL